MSLDLSELASELRLEDDGAPLRAVHEPQGHGCRVTWSGAESGVDGTWWPRTHDVVEELRELLPAVEAHRGGSVTRVSLNMADWPGHQPTTLTVRGVKVRLGWFRMLPSMTVTVGRGSDPRTILRVLRSA